MTIRHIHTNLQIRICNSELCKPCHTISFRCARLIADSCHAWTENQAQEFAYMVRYGMSPMAAIKSATSVAAQLLDQSVMKGGVIYKQ